MSADDDIRHGLRMMYMDINLVPVEDQEKLLTLLTTAKVKRAPPDHGHSQARSSVFNWYSTPQSSFPTAEERVMLPAPHQVFNLTFFTTEDRRRQELEYSVLGRTGRLTAAHFDYAPQYGQRFVVSERERERAAGASLHPILIRRQQESIAEVCRRLAPP